MEKLILSPAEVAESLSTSPNTILAAIQSGEIPAYREGRNWKVPKASLQQYVIDRAAKESAERRRTANDPDG